MQATGNIKEKMDVKKIPDVLHKSRGNLLCTTHNNGENY